MVRPESAFQTKCIELLEKHDFYARKMITMKAGLSDIIACAPTGRFCTFEIKREDDYNEPSALQHYNIAEVEKRKGYACSINSIEAMQQAIDSILN